MRRQLVAGFVDIMSWGSSIKYLLVVIAYNIGATSRLRNRGSIRLRGNVPASTDTHDYYPFREHRFRKQITHDFRLRRAGESFKPYVQIILSVIMVALILLQQTGASIGGAFGASDNMSSAHHTRRGVERGLFIATIIVAVLFAISALLNLI